MKNIRSDIEYQLRPKLHTQLGNQIYDRVSYPVRNDVNISTRIDPTTFQMLLKLVSKWRISGYK